MTPAKIASALLKPLISNGFNIYPLTSIFGGRKYSISPSKSEEMLLMALDQPSIDKKIRALRTAVLCGADINMELQRFNNKPLLAILSGCSSGLDAKDFFFLTKTLFTLGAKIDFEKYQEGSPLHDLLFFQVSAKKKLAGIELFSKYMSINHLNNDKATPLDYAFYFNSNFEYRSDIVSALRARGAIRGFGHYSSGLLSELPSSMAKVAFHIKDIIARENSYIIARLIPKK